MSNAIVPIKRALLSVFDKSGMAEFAKALAGLGVDLVSTGSTLKANGLKEVEVIAQVTSRLIVNRAALKTRPVEMTGWIDAFRAAREAQNVAA